MEKLESIERASSLDSCFKNTNLMALLLENVAAMRREIVDFLRSRWNEHLHLDHDTGKLEISGKSSTSLSHGLCY